MAPNSITQGNPSASGSAEMTGAAFPHQPPVLFDFSHALHALRAGNRVARLGWNGKGMYLWMLSASEVETVFIRDPHLKQVAQDLGGRVPCAASIRMRTADGTVVTGWLASQTDLFAEDWFVLYETPPMTAPRPEPASQPGKIDYQKEPRQAQPSGFELQVIIDKQLRRDIDEVLQRLKNAPASRERALAITKLQEAVMWLGMDLKALNEAHPGVSPNPYPNSKNPSNTLVEPTADGLKL